MAVGVPIRFNVLDAQPRLNDRKRLKQFLVQLFNKHGKEIDFINYIFCSDAYLLTLNQDHLNHNTLTDIITFELSVKDEPVLADIYISVERVKENANHFEVPVETELLRVIFHGALHICGFKDKKKGEIEAMRAAEDDALNAFLVPRGTHRL